MRSRTPQLALWRAGGLVAVGVGLVLGADYLPSPINLASGRSPAPAPTAHAEPATLTKSVCPGPEALGIEGLPDSPARTATVVTVAAASAPAAALPSGFVTGQGAGSLSISGLPSGGRWASPVGVRGRVVSGQVATAQSALVAGTGALAPGTVATQWSWTRTGNSRGLVTAACIPAADSSWLSAGGAAPGRLEHLVLANPGPNPVTVDLSVFGAKGRADPPGGQGLVVAGYGRRVLLLDALAGSEPSPVVHVTARGGKVAAILNDTWLDGLVPRGGDDVVSMSEPAREQIIAALSIDGRATLRVAVPGDGDAVVKARALTPGGPRSLPSGAVTRVSGRTTKDIDLSSLPPGAYGVQVRADVPVVAAAMLERRRAAGAPSDLAWSVASPPIRTLAGMALPASRDKGLTQRLDLAATGGPGSVRVTVLRAGGVLKAKEIAIGADSVSTLLLGGAISVWVTPLTGQVRAGVVTLATDAGGALLSLTPLSDLTLTVTPVLLRQLPD